MTRHQHQHEGEDRVPAYPGEGPWVPLEQPPHGYVQASLYRQPQNPQGATTPKEFP